MRREFQYPRQLAATSPHQRILQRLREGRHNESQIDARTSMEFSADEVSIFYSNNVLQEIFCFESQQNVFLFCF